MSTQNMRDIVSICTEAEEVTRPDVKPGRAWAGKLSRINSLMNWLEQKGMLTAEEIKNKQSLFRRYYRYYNDGDYPRGINALPGESVEEALERRVTDMFKRILTKYASKYNRREFNAQRAMDKLDTVIGVVKRYDVYALLNYWYKDLAPEMMEEVEVIREKNLEFMTAVREATPKDLDIENYVATAKIRFLKDAGAWNTDLEEKWKSVQRAMVELLHKMYIARAGLQKAIDLELLGS